MMIDPAIAIHARPSTKAPGAGPEMHTASWTNPAAAAALRSTVDMLTGIEVGVERNFTDVERVRTYAVDLKSTMDIFGAATTAISADGSQENDSFLPLIGTGLDGVTHAEARLSSKDLTATWPIERGDILAAIRRAKSISQNVADQLDPRSVQRPGT